MKTNTIADDNLKTLFRNYRKMSNPLKNELENRGFTVIKRKHWILKYENFCFVLPSSSSDIRAGLNFYSSLKRTLYMTK